MFHAWMPFAGVEEGVVGLFVDLGERGVPRCCYDGRVGGVLE